MTKADKGVKTMTEGKQIILLIISVHPWDDPRIFFKEALSLRKKYAVEIHAPADFQIKEEKGIRIVGLPRYQRRYLRVLNWVRLFFRAWKSPACYIHFHDSELIPIAMILKFFTGKKVIYDIHENLPAGIMTKSWIPPLMRKTLARVMDWVEKKAVCYFNGILLAEFSYVERFRTLPANMETVVNYPPKNFGIGVSESPLLLRQNLCQMKDNHQQVKFIYAGVISKSRGIEEIIKSFALVQKQGFNFHLYLVGPWVSPELRREMEEMIHNLNLTKQVTITGRISFQEVGCLYRQNDVGLALLHPEENYLTYLATKIFEYMAVGIPVLASNFPLWKLLIIGHQCGLTANPTDIDEISKKIVLLIKNRCLRCRLGANGWKVFNSHYNWDTQEKKLWEFYKRLEEL